MLLRLTIICTALLFTNCLGKNLTPDEFAGICDNVSNDIISEIAGYQDVANKIIDFILNGAYKGYVYNSLSNFTDTIGSRFASSPSFDAGVEYMLNLLKESGLENVHTEDAPIAHWERNNESATLISPRQKNIALLGLGSSVGTPEGGITAEVIVVKSFEELLQKRDQVPGKIVVFNEEFISYGHSVPYRTQGASVAGAVGAVATLIRSITPFSIYSPHTGWQTYEGNVTKIPTACITVEDAELLQRFQDRGQSITINLVMGAQNLPDTTSRNTIAEYLGKTLPNETVFVAGHLDSWDVGQGAMDDGGGAFIAWNALAILKQLGLRPRRTLRSILWTGEELGYAGANAYFSDHYDEIPSVDFVMESDGGTFTPRGVSFTGTDDAACIICEIVKLLGNVNATLFSMPAGGTSDVDLWIDQGVPGAGIITESQDYFWYHHSNGDTMTVEDTDSLDRCAAVWAVTAYVVADLSISIPRSVTEA